MLRKPIKILNEGNEAICLLLKSERLEKIKLKFFYLGQNKLNFVLQSFDSTLLVS